MYEKIQGFATTNHCYLICENKNNRAAMILKRVFEKKLKSGLTCK
jgi:hypothetical protein